MKTKRAIELETVKNGLTTVAELGLVYKTKSQNEKPKITGSKDAFNILKPFFADFMEHRESFQVLLVNRGNRVIGNYVVSMGGVAGTVADPKLIFQAALLCTATGIILAHNHPSGTLTPSQADMDLTRKIKDAAKLLDMQVLDHIILTENDKYFSFADEGML